VRPLAWNPPAPVIGFDHGHNNLHRADGTYEPLAALMRAQGANVRALDGPIRAEPLQAIQLLIIANARSARLIAEPNLPIDDSAFTPEEIATLRAWVMDGGAILLAADHLPFGSSAPALGRAFGIEIVNGYARDAQDGWLIRFARTDGTLSPHAITDFIDHVASFDGTALRPLEPGVWSPLLVLPERSVLVVPQIPRRFDATAHREPLDHAWQAAVRELGRGRVAVFGEAAMLTAQRMGPGRTLTGFGHPLANENAALVSSLVRWLIRRGNPRNLAAK
jgi:hypothetical protein